MKSRELGDWEIEALKAGWIVISGDERLKMPTKSTKSRVEPLHCPFCGRMPECGGAKSNSRYCDYQCGCVVCNIYFYSNRLRDAIRRWNKRSLYVRVGKRELKKLHKEVLLAPPELDPIQDRFI